MERCRIASSRSGGGSGGGSGGNGSSGSSIKRVNMNDRIQCFFADSCFN